jgi:Trk K+ transport system NAD-binding subunit
LGKQYRLQRRIVFFLAIVILLVLLCARLYMLGMHHLEAQERSFWQALETVVESMTTTGFGHDNDWQHPLMILYVIFLQVLGVFIVILIFPLYLIPFFEDKFEHRVPRTAPGMSDHIIIYQYSQALSSLLPQLDRAGRPTLLMLDDESVARPLVEEGLNVICRKLDDEGLVAAGINKAQTLVANGTDEENVSLALAARQIGFRGPILGLVSDPTYLAAMRMAGCSETLTPRHLLAAALAARASDKVNPTVAGAHQLGQHLEVRQIRVQPESGLAGLSLDDAEVGARTGAIVIGQWDGGTLRTNTGPKMVIGARSILVVVGSHESVEKLSRLAEGERPLTHKGPFVVVGSGEVGEQVVELLRSVGEKVVVVDKRDNDDVDLAGDILDHRTLEKAKVDRAQGVILAIDSDRATLFATVVIRDRCPRVPILARVNESENLEKIYRAGADFALSFSHVVGSLLAARLLGKQVLELDPQLTLLKMRQHSLNGRHPADLDIRARTGCSIVAVERSGELITNFPADFRFGSDDEIYLCGNQDALRTLQDTL